MSDVEAIKQLKYRYLRTLDTKQWDAFAGCFTSDATGDYAGLVFGNPDAVVDYMRTNLGSGMVTMHHCHHPEISVDGDSATGTWYLEDKVFAVPFRLVIEGAAFYSDTYSRTPQGWRIQHTGYERTFEVSYSMDAIEGFQLKEAPRH